MNILLITLLIAAWLLNVLLLKMAVSERKSYLKIKAKWDAMPKAARRNISKN